MKHFQHWQHVQKILEAYSGEEPLSRFLQQYFRSNKQMGSKDRKFASRYVYAFFRLGNALALEDLTIRVAIADFLCNSSVSPVAQFYLPQLSDADWILPLEEKLKWVNIYFQSFDMKDVFPLHVPFSAGITNEYWAKRMLQQPKLFIRVPFSKVKVITSIFEAQNIPFQQLSNVCFALPNTTKLADILVNEPYEVQDYASQQTGDFFKPSDDEYWWDCCAASGGKSLLLHSLNESVKILASDIRPQSLENLKQRFLQAGLTKFQVKTLDLLQNNKAQLTDYQFDGILVDAPCSGSGTWARTPENGVFFDPSKVQKYTYLQENIVRNVLPYLKSGKVLIYMTCSIFADENENMVARILKNHSNLALESAQLIDGSNDGADCMFVARFLKK